MAKVTEPVKPDSQTEEIPTPQISEPQAGQSLGQAGDSAADLSELLSNPEFEAYIDKIVKSKQDVRFGKYGTRIENLEEAVSQYDALVEGGMSKSEALSKMQGDQVFADMKARLDRLEGGDTGATSTGVGEPSWAEKQATILSDAGLEPDDSRLVELLRKETFANYDEYLEKLEEVSFEWKQSDAKKPQPSSSTVASTVPSAVAQAGDFDDYSDDQLADKLVELLRNPSINQGEINILDAELKERDAKK